MATASQLQKQLALWVRAGHTQTEFASRCGIDTGTCSKLFNGERGLTFDQRCRIIRAFRDDPLLADALSILVADLRDNIPHEAAEWLRVILDSPPVLRDQPSINEPVTRAKKEFQRLLDIDDPDTIDLVVALHEWKNQQR